LKSLSVVVLLMICAGLAGCGPRAPQPRAEVPVEGGISSARVSEGGTSARSGFDFYLLNLSWSPEFCATHPGSEECAAHPGFIVHGLWPQNSDGSYPQHCGSRPGPTHPDNWGDVMPNAGLLRHEWETHGTCTTYDADTYFGVVRKAFRQVKIPAVFSGTDHELMMPPGAILDAFAKANPGFPVGSIALSCGNNRLTAVAVCLAKDLQPMACSGVRSCRANAVKITPQG
jgi:ribonuclease T2